MALNAAHTDPSESKIHVEEEEEEEEKEDPLEKAKREQEELERALEAARDVNPNDDPAMKVRGRFCTKIVIRYGFILFAIIPCRRSMLI